MVSRTRDVTRPAAALLAAGRTRVRPAGAGFAGRLAASGPLVAVSLLLAACAHRPHEFDVTTRPTAERLPAPEAAAADLSGTWELDARASDRPGRAGAGGYGGERGMRGGRRGGMPGEEGGFPGGGGPPPRARGNGGGGGGGERRGPDSTLAGPRRLSLSQTDSSLTVGRPGGAATTLYFDGRTVYVPDPRGEGESEANGRWHRGRFEVRRSLPDGRTVTETYEPSKDGTKLTVRVRMAEGGRSGAGSTDLRRVYDRVQELGPAAGPAPSPPPSYR